MPTRLPISASPRSLATMRVLMRELLDQFRADLTEGMDFDAATARLNTLYGRDLGELIEWATTAATRQPIEERYLAAVQRALDAAKAEVLAKLAAKTADTRPPTPDLKPTALANSGAAADFLFDLGRFREELNYELRNVAATALQEAGQAQSAALGRDDVFTLPPQRALKFIRERENKLANVADDVFARVRDQLQAGLNAGDSTAKLAARVQFEFADMSREKASVIAQTEAGAAYGAANDEAIRQADGGRGRLRKKWLTSGLPNTRHSHLEAAQRSRDGIPLDEPFSNGLMYPGDENGPPEEVINCRCTHVAIEVGA